MKKSEIILQFDKSNIEETPIKGKAGKVIKSIMFIFMLSFMIALMSSCFWGRRGHGHYDHGHEGMEHHDDRR